MCGSRFLSAQPTTRGVDFDVVYMFSGVIKFWRLNSLAVTDVDKRNLQGPSQIDTHRSSESRCFLRSCLLPGSTSMPISCFQISSSFEAWIHSKSLFLMTGTFRVLPRLKHIEVRNRVAFCAPASYRGQLQCQFHVFIFHQVLKLEPIQNHCSWPLDPSGTFPDWFWSTLGIFIFSSWLACLGSFSKVFWEGTKAMFFSFLQNWCVTCFFLNMSSVLEFELDRFFMSWFRLACVVPYICVEASIFYLRTILKSWLVHSAPHRLITRRKATKYTDVPNSVAFCAPASYCSLLSCKFHVLIFH